MIELEAKCGLEFSSAGGGVSLHLSSLKGRMKRGLSSRSLAASMAWAGWAEHEAQARAGSGQGDGGSGPGLLVNRSPAWNLAQNSDSEIPSLLHTWGGS